MSMIGSPPTIQPPPFPVQFFDDHHSALPALHRAQPSQWPTDDARPTSLPAVDWVLKTDREAYLATLESKLNRITSPALASTSKSDSGYASSSPRQIPFPSEVDAIEEEVGSYGDIPVEGVEDDAREGDGLLWGTPRSARDHSAASNAAINGTLEGDVQGNGQPTLDPPSSDDERSRRTPSVSPPTSPIQAYLIPPTPSRDASTPTDTLGTTSSDAAPAEILEFRIPSELADEAQARSRRISFKSSVRISSGIGHSQHGRGGGHNHPHAPLSADLFSSTTLTDASFRKPRSASTSSLPRNASSRSGSPSPATHARDGSTSSLQPHQHHSGYSSTATSAVPSRSSSPCSSIYAPLQPPSQTCPSPLLVRPPVKKPTNNRDKGLTFTEYLRGKADVGEEVGGRGYRELVEAQRRKKARWEQRRGGGGGGRGGYGAEEGDGRGEGAEGGGGFWGSVKALLATGAASAGSRGGRSYSTGYGTMDGTKRSSRRRRNSISPDDDEEGPDDEDVERRSSSRGRGSGGHGSRATGRPTRRKPSTLSLSSVSDADDESDAFPDESHSVASDDEFYGIQPGPAPRRGEQRPKTQADVMFGPAPTRWTRWDWVVWKVRGGMRLVGCCLGAREREEDEESRI